MLITCTGITHGQREGASSNLAHFEAPLAAAHQPHGIAHVQEQRCASVPVARLDAQLLLGALCQHRIKEGQLKTEAAPLFLGRIYGSGSTSVPAPFARLNGLKLPVANGFAPPVGRGAQPWTGAVNESKTKG